MNEANSTIDNMMTDMTVKTTGDAHYDFLVTMVLHHQGVIDMAEGELRCGQNQHLKVIVQEIIVDQTQGIALMRLVRGEPLPQPGSSPTQIHAGAVSTAPAEAGVLDPR